ncbi:hypothetical protein [Flavobacterium terrae]|uniref:Uncharacterized protein n=1 Tax=Flavobacterium terrae TaxID=415425 RepID=A0A1M6EGM9_9FLAO|nr:hypothetical protein [Flavobacterium terrae]SHI84642.1 hypothetical protein SAMN05444363_1765 [Flavobacterium terrae]
MKSKLRTITIGNITYKYVVEMFSLKIFNPAKNSNNEFVKVSFDTRDDLYVGSLIFSGHFKTYKNDEEIILNINTPSFVKEIIIAISMEKFDFTIQKQYQIDNGLQILEEFGYEVTGLENKVRKKGYLEEDLKPETVNEVLLALKQNQMPLATALVYDNLDCTLLDAKRIAENLKRRVL